jgi:hypothetical protein
MAGLRRFVIAALGAASMSLVGGCLDEPADNAIRQDSLRIVAEMNARRLEMV